MRSLAGAALVGVTVASLTAAQQPLFSTRVERVRLDVLVTREGKSVPELTAADFEVTDNAVRQAVEVLDRGAAMQVMLALDTSDSVIGPRLEELVRASRAVVGLLEPHDRVGLLTFSELVVRPVPTTHDRTAVLSALERLTGGGRTRLFDAAFAAVALSAGETTRSLVLVFTDGADTGSWLSHSSVIETARHAEVVIYGVTVPEVRSARGPTGRPTRSQGGEDEALEDLVKSTGGRLVRAASDDDLTHTFLNVLSEFRGRYVLVYTPTGVRRDDGWHSVRVRVKGGGQVQVRKGYMARQ